ncbi:phosphate acyltransferase PlsX [Methylocystis bryophila]|uniref:Phosphate acyltransferase n=1 Tax=Methylocystis bryophila TaxID=655015 RepID=A0A1W6MXH4_9HYPH|nr:phosphate acyltransferase PlsX [Methylocystis bryophila]ARN82295.1 phosphate acyltransferase [Methylocystis bryophila]BDV38443.1 phosphate acyltransferase [Methylocystis bryophila]
MGNAVRIAVDAMGGDIGPSVTLAGAASALKTHQSSEFLLFGDEAVVTAELAKFPELAARARIIPASVSIGMDTKPSIALRQGRRVSSMWMAIEAVKKGEAEVAVSAGNTGALMAMATFCLRTMSQIDRPALACLWPTLRGHSVVLDVGAAIGGDAVHLVNLAIMGAAMARIMLNVECPRVGLLNIGVEEIKGVDQVKEASKILKELELPMLDYRGFIEGDRIGWGEVDVVVTEGFSGNIAIKTAEGTAKQFAALLREALGRSLVTKLGAWIARSAFTELKTKMDPRQVNGAVFLGLEGVVIKSHGGADAFGFARAVEIGCEMVEQDLLARIRQAATLVEGRGAPRAAQAQEAAK